MDSIKVISEPDSNNPYAVIYKPKGLPSAPLSENDKKNALFMAMELFPQLSAVCGKKEIEHGLLHRLDTATDGLILIAATQDFYDFMTEEQAEGRFIKYYTARCNYLPENTRLLDGFSTDSNLLKKVDSAIKEKQNLSESIKIESYFRSFGKGGKSVRPVTKESGAAALKKIGKPKLYATEIVSIKNTGKDCEVICRISQGFRHQVRCHLAWAGLPVINDSLYNSNCAACNDELQFSATRIEFKNPMENKLKVFDVDDF